ncbi:MAG TPA: hypothetical protein VFQ70_01980 [Candidatus Saccharimonadaceae bacterium]|nr:hypothetical protein [Candidatus Saccharimonadaceae bacterium]
MKFFSLPSTFAATYNCGTYGAGLYDSSSCTTTQSTSNPSGNGNLANTGMDVYLPLAIGVVLVVTALTLITVSIVRKVRAAKK